MAGRDRSWNYYFPDLPLAANPAREPGYADGHRLGDGHGGVCYLPRPGAIHPELDQRRDDIIEDVVQASIVLAEKRFGALIVLQREVGLNEYMEIGTRLDARVSRELMESVFQPHSPVHDGALVIQRGRVTAARCVLPLSTNPNLRKTWGTRHRAAIGVTEETDAVAIVISEQEGTVALVVGGNVTENIDSTRLRSALRELVRA